MSAGASPSEALDFTNQPQQPARDAWRAWLEAHHAQPEGVWVVQYKRPFAAQGLTYQEALEEALCFGWIDGTGRRLDEARFVLRYSPRRRGSIWSLANQRRVEALIREGRMAEPGLRAIEAAKASGEWEAAIARELREELPGELEAALDAEAAAGEAFRAWPPSRRKQLIYWVASARKPETRAARVRAVVAMCLGEEPHP